jgi:hypothetical protein
VAHIRATNQNRRYSNPGYFSLLLGALFLIFGLLAPHNPTLVATLLVCALTVSSAIVLILEMYQPFAGLLRPATLLCCLLLLHLADVPTTFPFQKEIAYNRVGRETGRPETRFSSETRN